MRISDSQRLLFIHIQKTGGLTMEHILNEHLPDVRGPQPMRHATLETVLGKEPDLASYWTFGVVRNPWARMVSWWSMIQQGIAGAKEGKKGSIRRVENYPVWKVVSQYPDFETFLFQGPEDLPRIGRPQIAWLETPTKQADYIGRTETLPEAIRVVHERLGVDAPEELPHKNKGSHGSYHDFYTDRTRQRVATLFARDIEEFGYEF